MRKKKSARPTTMAAVLREVAGYLDLADDAFETLAHIRGDELHLGSEIQDDLRRLAYHLAHDPGLDRKIYRMMMRRA